LWFVGVSIFLDNTLHLLNFSSGLKPIVRIGLVSIVRFFCDTERVYLPRHSTTAELLVAMDNRQQYTCSLAGRLQSVVERTIQNIDYNKQRLKLGVIMNTCDSVAQPISLDIQSSSASDVVRKVTR